MDNPSVDCLGEMIAGLNSGAVNGLQTLGLVPDNLTGPDLKAHVKTAFSQLHQEVSNMLSDDEQERMGFNGVVLEHTLCKVGRFLGAGAYGEWGFRKVQKKKRKAQDVVNDEDQENGQDNEEGSSSRKKKKTASRKGKERATE